MHLFNFYIIFSPKSSKEKTPLKQKNHSPKKEETPEKDSPIKVSFSKKKGRRIIDSDDDEDENITMETEVHDASKTEKKVEEKVRKNLP